MKKVCGFFDFECSNWPKFFFWPEVPPIKPVLVLKKLEEEVLNQERECIQKERLCKRKSTKKDDTFVEEKKGHYFSTATYFFSVKVV